MTAFKVLLVDDETEFLETLVKRLTKRKLDVIGTTSGKEALRILNETPVDVIVLDVKMPGYGRHRDSKRDQEAPAVSGSYHAHGSR